MLAAKYSFASYVTVGRPPGSRSSASAPRQIIRVSSGIKDVHHVADAVAACVHGRGASGYKAFLPVLFLQVHDATAGPEGKFGITLVLDDRTQVVNDNVVDYGRAGKELLQVTLAAPLASRQIVGRLGRVFVRGIVAMMRGHMGKAVEDVDRIGVVYHLHAFAHILYRHAVVVLVQRDVTVALDAATVRCLI